MIELIDTHAHLTDPKLAVNLDQILARAREGGVVKIVTVGAGPDDCRAALSLAERYDHIFAVIGIHPHLADDFQSLDSLRPMLEHPKLLALGETGLDYYYDFGDRQNQRNLFQAHLELARETDLPVVVHCRDAFDDTLAILRSAPRGIRGVFHCFAGDPDQAAQVLELGWFISFAGTVTFKNADNLRQTARTVPLDRLVVETDSPYLSPEPVRKIRLNEPAHVLHTAKLIADLRKLSLDEFARRTCDNAIKLFGPKLSFA
jgi:TatD DNase family protein